MVTHDNGLAGDTDTGNEQDQMPAWLRRASQTSARLWPGRGGGENLLSPSDGGLAWADELDERDDKMRMMVLKLFSSQVIDKPGEDKNTKGMSIAVVTLIHLY